MFDYECLLVCARWLQNVKLNNRVAIIAVNIFNVYIHLLVAEIYIIFGMVMCGINCLKVGWHRLPPIVFVLRPSSLYYLWYRFDDVKNSIVIALRLICDIVSNVYLIDLRCQCVFNFCVIWNLHF